jgi:hypothetical protein
MNLHEKDRIMNMHRPLFTSALLPLAIAMMGAGLWWAATPASAQVAAAARAPGAAVTAAAPAAATTTTATAVAVPIRGTVTGLPESVSFAGIAQLSASVVTDPDFGAIPTVVLSIDLGKITGIGSSTGTRYVTASQETMNRRLGVADTVQFTFPFSASGGSAMSSRVGMASFNLSFNVSTMKLTGATAQIGSP